MTNADMKTLVNSMLLLFAVLALAGIGMAMAPSEPQGMTVVATVKK